MLTGMKNPHAVALGRLGGIKGGQARARALSAGRRREISQKAVAARWEKEKVRLHADRIFRRQKAVRIATRWRVDPGDVEHVLFNLTLEPLERLARSFSRAGLKGLSTHRS